MKRVITYGTFDLLHYGHIHLLRRARELGDYLIVGLSTDEFNRDGKHKTCYFPYEKRKQLLEAIRYVDLVIPEESWDQKERDVGEYHVDTFVMGTIGRENSIFSSPFARWCICPVPPEISSTKVRRDLEEGPGDDPCIAVAYRSVRGRGDPFRAGRLPRAARRFLCRDLSYRGTGYRRLCRMIGENARVLSLPVSPAASSPALPTDGGPAAGGGGVRCAAFQRLLFSLHLSAPGG